MMINFTLLERVSLYSIRIHGSLKILMEKDRERSYNDRDERAQDEQRR